MSNLINRYVLDLLPKISLPAEKREKVAEALTQFIEAQVTSELDQVCGRTQQWSKGAWLPKVLQQDQ